MRLLNFIIVILSVIFFCVGLGMSIIPPQQFIEIGSIIAVSTISLPAFYALWKLYRWRGIATITALGLFALTIESIGIHTGFPYSHFEYTMPFGYRLLGTTPWTVFIAWSPLVIGSYLIANKLCIKKWSQFLVYIGILVSSDIVLDPGAVARGLWQYTNGGLWFNVPLQNFAGWIFSGSLAYIIICNILRKNHSTIQLNSNSKTYSQLGTLSLLLSIFLWSGVNAGYALWLPAIIGIILGNILLYSVIKKPLRQ